MNHRHKRIFEDTVNQRFQTVSSKFTAVSVSSAPITTHLKPEESRAETEIHSTFSIERSVEEKWESEPNKDNDTVDKPGTAQVNDVHSIACDRQLASMTSEVIP